jgi:hypothetical protein
VAGPTEQPTLPAPDRYCWRCAGSGVVTNGAIVRRDGEYECETTATTRCPICRPELSARERWLEVVRLGRREP